MPSEIRRITDEVNKVGNEIKECPIEDSDRYIELQIKLNDLGQQLTNEAAKHAAANVGVSWQQAKDALLWESICIIALISPLP